MKKFEVHDDVEEKSRKALTDEIVKFIEERLQEPHSESQLIAVLHKVQNHFGYLGKEHLEAVSQLMQIPSAKVSGVASFYHYFRLKPRGRFIIEVCMGTACHVKGAEAVAKKLQEELGINFGETTNDGFFTLEEARCIGMCALAPVMKVGEDVYPQVTPDQVPSILEKYFAMK